MSITLERESAIGIVRLNTPPANAYTRDSLNELAQVIHEIRADMTIRTVVITSAVDKFFCAGADISVLDGQEPHGFADFLALAHETVDMIEETPKIFIAAIAGHCIGGGLELALACDFRIAAEGKYGIGLGEINLGLSPGMGGTQRLPRLIGAGHALHMMVTGEMLRPEQALDRGIVEWLHPTESHWDEVLAYADRLSSGPSAAQGRIKLSMKHGLAGTLEQGLAMERANQACLFKSNDATEGIKAFMEKRKPEFTGS